MRLFPQERFEPKAAPRHARLFELIRQDNLTQKKTPEFLEKTRALAAQESFCTLAHTSLRRAS